MPRSRQRAPVIRAAVLRSSPPRCAVSPSVPKRPPPRFPRWWIPSAATSNAPWDCSKSPCSRSIRTYTGCSNTQVKSMQDAVRGVEQLMNGQEQAIAGIHTAVGNLFELSTNTNEQTVLLNELAANLNAAAGELSLGVGRFKL